MTFTVAAMPLHGSWAAQHPILLRRTIRALNADSIGLTEAYPTKVRATLASLRGYRTVIESGGKDKRRGQYDNPILVRSSLRSLGSGQLWAADQSDPEKFAPERWHTFSVVEAPAVGPVAHVNLHPHALIQSRTTDRMRLDTDRGRKARGQFDALDRLLLFCTAQGWQVVVTGDLNFRDQGTDPASPYALLRDHGLRVNSRGIVALASSPDLKLRVESRETPGTITDHPALVGVCR